MHSGKSGDVDVILQDHNIAHFEVRVESTRRVGGDQHFNAAELHDSDGHRYFGQSITFIGVKSALHKHDFYAVEFAKEQPGLVSWDGRLGEIGDVAVVEHIGVFEKVSETG